MPDIRTVGIIAKPGVPQAHALVPELLAWLKGRGIHARCDFQTAAYTRDCRGMEREAVPDGAELVIVLGGDGTLLSAARAVGGRPIPLFAVNLGGLGFLTAIPGDQLYPELELALDGGQRVSPRRMLHCDVIRNDETIASYEALNDVVLTKSSIARMIDLEAHVDSHFVCTYKADGLIIATPTGSTAYSLSAGGPIVFPAVAALCLTPICPHMLTNRPVLVPDTSSVKVICRSENESTYLTIDGQVGEPVRHNDVILCRSSEHSIRLVRPPRMLFFDVLRAKLKWGER